MKKGIMFFVLLASSVFAQMETGTVVRMYVLNTNGIQTTVAVEGWTIQYNSTNYEGQVIALNVGTNGILTSGRIVASEVDIQTTDPYRGFILTDPATNKWVVTVDTNGLLITTLLTTSPEVDFATRVARIKSNETARISGAVKINTGGTTAVVIQGFKEFLRVPNVVTP